MTSAGDIATSAGESPEEREQARERQSFVRHELRAPLAVMYPLISLLTDEAAGPLTGTQREYLEMLERNLKRLNGLIASAAESGWLDCAAAPRRPAAVPLAEVADEVIARPSGTGRAARLVVVREGDRAVAWADRDHAHDVVRNLVDNALRYTSGAVAVRVSRAHGAVALAVEDEGPGMSTADAEEAFEFGVRGEAARDTGAPGLGAGLWVCRRLAQLNGGSITLQTGVDRGTTVVVSLPACDG